LKGSDVLEIVHAAEDAGIDIWLDGGWGIDALLEKQTREHTDLDVVVALDQVERIVWYTTGIKGTRVCAVGK
jgi:lincosamide nucleotidyltransferase A/C/D/E